MLTRTLDLPTPLTLIPARSLDGVLTRLRRDHPHLPSSVEELETDLSARESVPATFPPPGRRQQALALYGRGWLALLVPAPDARAYQVRTVTALRFDDHHRLARGCLLLRPTAWTIRHTAAVSTHTHWDLLRAEWELLRKESATKGHRDPDGREARRLDLLTKAVDTEHEVQRERAAAARPFTYRDVQPTDRHATYTFVLHGRATPAEDEVLRVRGEASVRGQVVAVDQRAARLTLALERPVDWQRLPKQGELERVENTVVHARRTDALTALRDGHARNPRLLPILTGTRTPRTSPRRQPDAPALDRWQSAALHTALAADDLAAIIGPPGTGKTTVITQLAQEAAKSGERVLVTAHSNTAVDNVLTRLPAGLVVLRVGAEHRVDPAARHLLLDHRAADLRQGVLDRVGARLAAHTACGPGAEHRPKALYDAVGALETAQERRRDAEAALAEARRGVAGPAQTRLDRTAERLRRTLDRSARTAERRARLSEQPPGWWRDRRLRRADKALAVYGEAVEQAERDRRAAEGALDEATRDHPAVRERRADVDRAAREVTRCRKEAEYVEAPCRALLAPVGDAPADLYAFARWARTAHPLLAARRALLAEWRDDVRAAGSRLHAELVRYAHVVGATSSGAAGPALLTGVDFDLAVLDEAGQITTADALVPLVRARRAVLVGDHRQLPPYADEETVARIGAEHGPQAAESAVRSVLELLQEHLPDTAVAHLRTQRRMPREIADFCSKAFYDGQLLTENGPDSPEIPGARRSTDPRVTQLPTPHPLFRTPLVLVDTCDLPPAERAEGGTPQGRINRAEAALLAALARRCTADDEEWAVIVPYRAQAALIRNHLRDLPPGRGDIATVDSFQGGERDVVLYGFTRSNPAGTVGFLDELRRANVAFTRARRRLVLVGDFDTLTRATDDGFRALARALRDHTATVGESLPSRDLQARLGARTA
ncbi:AAA family ATPase [Streptomyces roseirectus]|uniref:AAA family ATPase n=1 Tax=Streptomyces roseirectus TaxID=2768066 RepID=A0A7H0I8L5_9ACTN|nr:AAA domain-containing protein [Streptomyces roseirectus]QNP69131.1 AAA family ATPase [Streptomyces roseirectus]